MNIDRLYREEVGFSEAYGCQYSKLEAVEDIVNECRVELSEGGSVTRVEIVTEKGSGCLANLFVGAYRLTKDVKTKIEIKEG